MSQQSVLLDARLRYFYEAANLGSMRLASDRIGVAVSSISRQISQLEQVFGVALIERGRRSIRLTQAGRLVHDFYKQQLADSEALTNRLQELREMKSGRVDLAIGEGFLNRSVTEALEQFQQRNPGISLTIQSPPTAEIIRMVLEDEAHIGMILSTTAEPKIRTRVSVAQPLNAVCSPGHPLAGKTSVTLADLAKHDLCLPPLEFRIRQALRAAEKRAQAWLNPAMTTTSIHMMRELAKDGQMVTILPTISIVAELEEGSLVSVPLRDEDLEHSSLSLIYRLGRQLDGAPARLLQLLEARLKTWTDS
ncbi:LysR family transcriptional regulator [Pacificimonas flava]|uniref:LysR family transcriptional regulator n=2 Tax=Pacificimonas TaxID=1960290 RepID=A0A219B5C8_9SPHN|nr:MULTISPECIES: LysR family transcriptional regulator [Pacificimonas]MBZ6379185.1 LysR family transcriptional regulator [Pacificimonas aurantium]OWV33592.1 LysR family transcriptional regulator [Pacificimonas flava]